MPSFFDPEGLIDKKLTAMEETPKQCEYCRYWNHIVSHNNDSIRLGNCRAYPPIMGGFPVVNAQEWCGYYSPDGNRIEQKRGKS